MRPLRLFVVACALTTLLVATAACSGESNDASASRPRERASARHKARHQDPGCRFIVASDGKRALSGPKGLEYLTDAVVEPTTCYDKITFTFDQGNNPDMPPGYTVQYRKAPYVQVGGQPLHSSTEGFKAAHAVLVVEFTPASTFDGRNPGAGRTTYKGNLRLLFDSQKVHHTAIVEWLDKYPDTTPDVVTDNKLVWLIGLDTKRPFTVDAASTPPRVNVLIMR